jgi:hypothetical protein
MYFLRYFCASLPKTRCREISAKICNTKFHENPSDGSRLDTSEVTDRRFTVASHQHRLPHISLNCFEVCRTNGQAALALSCVLHFNLNCLGFEIRSFLGCYTAYSGESLPIFRDNLSVPTSGVNKSNYYASISVSQVSCKYVQRARRASGKLSFVFYNFKQKKNVVKNFSETCKL